MKVLPLAEILTFWQPGDAHSWEVEFAWLRGHHQEQLDKLANHVQVHGLDDFEEPIQLGDDGRCWDGHHRLCVAEMLAIEWIPVDLVAKQP